MAAARATVSGIYCALDELLERVAGELNRRAIWRELGDECADAGERARAMDVLVEAIEERATLRPLAPSRTEKGCVFGVWARLPIATP